MRLSEFVLLDMDSKGKTLLHEGIFLAKRKSDLFIVFLFQMDNFYSEIICNVKTRQVEEYRTFDETKFLTPYLEEISIDDLLS